MTDLHDWSLVALSQAIRTRQISPVEVTETLLGRIAALDGGLKSYVTLMADQARAEAKTAEAEIMAGRYRGPLHGVPVAVKDLIHTRGVATGAGMTIHRDFVPDYDATAVKRLRRAGAVLLGKLRMTEGAILEHHPDLPKPQNPWNAAYWPGVSSSGSGVATAAGLCYASLGSDTGGSIRYPCHCNGLTGVKTTAGLVSRHGAFDLSTSFDTIGPIARSAADAAALLGAVAGYDPDDPTTLQDAAQDYLAALAGIDGARGMRIGIDARFIGDGVDSEVRTLVEAAAAVLREIGAELVDIAYPDPAAVLAAHGTIASAEMAYAHRETYPSRAGEYGPWFTKALNMGLATSAVAIGGALRERDRFRGRYLRLFAQADAVLTPVASFPTPTWEEADRLIETRMDFISRFTSPLNAAGTPSVTLPCGFTADGRPVGFQLAGPALSEARLLRIAHAYQQATDWHLRRPALRKDTGNE